MRNRRTIFLTVMATALLTLCLPSLAAAQGRYDPYGRPDYRRDRDYRRDDDYGRYGNRYLRDSVHRLKELSDRFEDDLDRALDRSRIDGTHREDNLNQIANDFHDATKDLKDRFDDGRDMNRSAREAQRVLDLGGRMDRVAQRLFHDNRLRSQWMQIRQELRVIADAYGYRMNGYDDDYYRRNDTYRRDDPYQRDDPYRRRSRTSRTIQDILRRIP